MAKKPTEVSEEFTVEVPNTGYVRQELTPVTTSEVNVSVEEPRPTEIHYEFQASAPAVPTPAPTPPPTPTPTAGGEEKPGAIERARTLLARAREAIKKVREKRTEEEKEEETREETTTTRQRKRQGRQQAQQPRVIREIVLERGSKRGGARTTEEYGVAPLWYRTPMPRTLAPARMPVIGFAQTYPYMHAHFMGVMGFAPTRPYLHEAYLGSIGLATSRHAGRVLSVIAPVGFNPWSFTSIGYRARPVGIPTMWVGLRVTMPGIAQFRLRL